MDCDWSCWCWSVLSVLWYMVWGTAVGSWGLCPIYLAAEGIFSVRKGFSSESDCQGASGSLCKYKSIRIYREHWKDVLPLHLQCVLAFPSVQSLTGTAGFAAARTFWNLPELQLQRVATLAPHRALQPAPAADRNRSGILRAVLS